MRIQNRIWLVLCAAAFLATVAISSTREAHLLCLRLVIPFGGKTFVQGQPPGCMLYVVPNVQFSESYSAKLIETANRSADDFALAGATGEWDQLRFPPAQSWTNRPLLEWGAIVCCYLDRAYRTNADDAREALKLVHAAQAVDPDNGALWLGEALVSFGQRHDEAGVTALQLAAAKTNWSVGSERDFQYLTAMYLKAGLSRLDAGAAANSASRDNFWGMLIQNKLKFDLSRLMADAVNSTNDEEFLKLLTLLVDLRKADRSEWNWNVTLQNTFRFFGAGDELAEAMGKRMGMKWETPSEDAKPPDFDAIFRDYLALQTNQAVVGRFWGQADVAQTEKKLRREIRSGPIYRHEMNTMFAADLSGIGTTLALYVIILAILQQLPFAWLRRSGEIRGTWPKRPAFWVLSGLFLTIGVIIGTRFFSALGIFNIVGLVPESFNRADPHVKAIVVSIGFCVSCLLFWLLAWKITKKRIEPGYILMGLGCLYLLGIVAMAFWRSQLLAAILANR
jgi:hypothetical protein